jgi:thioredoxin 1
MPVINSSDTLLRLDVAEHRFVLLKYHADECGKSCLEFIPVFESISDDPKYKDVLFLRINVDNNPAAKKYILEKKQPIVTVYRNGRLIETVQTCSREQVEALLDKLLSEE